MKRLFPSLVLAFALIQGGAFGQSRESPILPRLAVVEFSTNNRIDRTVQDGVTVRNLVESQMIASGKYQIITREEIDKLLVNQQIAISSISSRENVQKLQLQNISYIVTGSVDAMGSDYAVTVKVLDVGTGQFSHSANRFMGGSSRELYTGVQDLMAAFIAGTGSSGGQVVRAEGGAAASGIGIKVSTALAGVLYFEGKEAATLWDNDSYTIPIEKPGTYTVKLRFGNGRELSRTMVITNRGIAEVRFGDNLEEFFVRIPGGTFLMGSPASEGGRDDDEGPQHQVTVGGFYMGRYEVTQQEWVEVMGSNPSNWKGDNLPVEQVSWYDAIEYCNRRSVKEGLSPAYTGNGNNVTWNRGANGYRLPTEAEWEYAAQGGGKDPLMYSGSNTVDVVGWYAGNSGSRTHTVGTKQPNSLGLYDMSGNVYEWCWDWYGSYSSSSQTDPSGPASGSYRVLRGGGWDYSARGLRSAYRGNGGPSYRYSYRGFRLARALLP
jgi:formylglycine-generating enzyme required for sulfatase activity